MTSGAHETATTVAISGASGFIGTSLTAALRGRGDRVLHLVRRTARGPDEVEWRPGERPLDPGGLADVDVVVNLAGVGIGDRRWNAEHRAAVLRSRVDAAATIVDAILANDRRTRLVNASAVGFYGDRGEEQLTEASPAGVGYITEVVRAWEAATAPLADHGAPVAMARTGLVMDGSGGAFPRMARLTSLGLGGPLGSGRQFWPLISLRDAVRGYLHLIDRPDVTGPVNLVGVEPVRQRAFAAALGRALHRPALVPAPRIALRLVIGEFATEILASQRVQPERLLASGFEHLDGDLPTILRTALAASR